jgi:outer membrane protein assembly factor BamB
MAAPTPAGDGKRIFALYSTNDVIALDLEGNLLWLRGLTRDYPGASNSVGMSSSPVVVGETLVVLVENDTHSFAAGLDIHTGANRWKITRPAKVNWTSPVVFHHGGNPAVLLQSLAGLAALEPVSGRELWSLPLACDAIASLARAGDVLYLPLASGKAGMAALRAGSEGNPPEVLWETNRLRASTASPLAAGGKVLAIAGSVLKCADAGTGELIWQLRLTGSFSSSPVASGNRLYCFNEDGLCQTVEIGDREGKVIGTGDLGEAILSTPAIAHDALFIRSDGHLWKIAATK